MLAKRVPAHRGGDDLLQRLQDLLYEFHARGRFDEARPLILWLMEIAHDSAKAPADTSA